MKVTLLLWLKKKTNNVTLHTEQSSVVCYQTQSDEQHIHTARTDSQEHHQQTQHSINSHFQYITVRPVDSLTERKTRKQPRTFKLQVLIADIFMPVIPTQQLKPFTVGVRNFLIISLKTS